MAPLIGRIKTRLFKQIHAEDADCGLNGGQHLFVGLTFHRHPFSVK